MRITAETAQYLDKVLYALETAGPAAIDASNWCPECEQEITLNVNDRDHIVWYPAGLLGADTIVIVACEGYWMIDPTRVGLPKGHWQSVEDLNWTRSDEDY